MSVKPTAHCFPSAERSNLLDPAQVGNLDKAIENAREFTAETVGMLRAAPAEDAKRVGVAS